jgi:hypothetical protein
METPSKLGAVKFKPHETKDWVEVGSTIHIDFEEDEIITQRLFHIELGKYFNKHGKYPEKVTMSPAQWLHFRAALGLYGLVKQYEYMEFIIEPVQVVEKEKTPSKKTAMEEMTDTINVA